MSSSDDEQENFCYYGTPLDPYDEDTFPKRKPIGVEEQIATDAQGRRRFHGAFTGGFSAGFFNTVGTPEGWSPAEFKSSRADKAAAKQQRPQDFMDEEDMGEFGIAPETVKATDEFSTKKKRKKQPFSTGPIPGVPVLHTLLEVHTETIGYTLMKNMGWKVVHESDDEVDEDLLEGTSDGRKVYGCEIPKEFRTLGDKFKIGAKVLQQTHPYDEYVAKPKDNTFGMGYKGLDRSIFGHVNLLEPSSFVVREKNKRSTIRGQAFGVGAFEREDEDIYKADDMAKYDFSLEDEAKPKPTPKALEFRKREPGALDGFVKASQPFEFSCAYPLPTIPHSFTGKHKQKRSRFEPLPQEAAPAPKSHDADSRRLLLEERDERRKREEEERAKQRDEARKHNLEMLLKSDRFVAEQPAEAAKVDPFAGRFVSPAAPDDPTNALVEVKKSENMHGTKDMRKAAEMKMFGPLTRTSNSWNPDPLLCKRFNVPVPLFDGYAQKKDKEKRKLLVFEYQKAADAAAELKPGLTETKVQEIVEAPADAPPLDTIPILVPPLEEPLQPIQEAPVVEEISPDKNIDLFKAVFLSSSDESEPEAQEQKETHADIITKEIQEAILPKIAPRKMGILSNITFMKPNRSEREDVTPQAESTATKTAPASDLYGPQLPLNKPKTLSGAACSAAPRFDNNEWVEKTSPKHHKTKKKHKKSSHHKSSKHKKHKKEKR